MSYFKAAVCFHVEFAEFFYSINIELIVDACRFVSAANIIFITQRLAYYLFALFTGCVFNQNACHSVFLLANILSQKEDEVSYAA